MFELRISAMGHSVLIPTPIAPLIYSIDSQDASVKLSVLYNYFRFTLNEWCLCVFKWLNAVKWCLTGTWEDKADGSRLEEEGHALTDRHSDTHRAHDHHEQTEQSQHCTRYMQTYERNKASIWVTLGLTQKIPIMLFVNKQTPLRLLSI